jgi:hypothetical protein
LKRLQEDIMQVNLGRGKAASAMRSVTRLAILAGVPLIAALTLSVPERALAACGTSRPAGVHTATARTGAHTTTSRPATSGGGGGGGGGTLGCANGSSVIAAPHALPVASSGKVVEGGAHLVAHTTPHPSTAAAKTSKSTNASAHLRGVKPPKA